MMKNILLEELTEFVNNSEDNHLSAEDAIAPDLAGLRLYDAPIMGFAAADDKLFTEVFKQEGVIHPDYKAPREWLENAQTVVSFFLPFSEEVRRSNRGRYDEPYEEGIVQTASAEWLHARIEGQAFMNQATAHVQKILQEMGHDAVVPMTTGGFTLITPFISNWSERHAAYAAGLGTFGLSRGLITEKGMAGRFGSVITSAKIEPTERPYQNPFEYCTMCGACQARCPAQAIDRTKGCANGKDQLICGPYVDSGRTPPHGPNGRVYYGCGKCQVGVPCESGIPVKNGAAADKRTE